MRSENGKTIEESLVSVMPYVAYPGELKELIRAEEAICASIEEFIENFRRKNSAISDATKRTDGQIFLNELRRNLEKSGSD